MEDKTIYSSEIGGSFGRLSIKIDVGSDRMLDFDKKDIRIATRKAVDLIQSAILLDIKKEDPNTLIETKKNRELLDVFFPEAIFIEEIPNGYYSSSFYEHLPWFIVTTKIGRIEIGWRKRVISIDWSDSIALKNGCELFKDEDVTKGDDYIHAWSIEKAEEYINKIIENI